MIDPYRMIVINVIASLLLGIGIFVYTYIYPKKRPKLFVLLLLVSLLPLISILRKGSYESGDLSLHAKFAMQFFDNLQQGNFIPKWIATHCSGYGCPVYIFLFNLPYYLISLFHFLGFSFIASVKWLIALSYIASGIGMYLWIKDELGEKAAFVAAIFYLYSPYHLIDLHFRVSIGELLSLAFLPFIFLSVKKSIETQNVKYFIINAVLLAMLILSHQATTLASFPLILLYSVIVWFRGKERQVSTLFKTFFSFFYGILLAAFFWIPVLAEGKYTYFIATNTIAFHPISSFLYSPDRFGLLFQGHHGEFYFNIGYVQWIIIGVSIYLLLKKKIQGKEKVLLIFGLTTFIIFFLMMQSISKPIWDAVSVLKNFQFSWRLLIEIIFVVSLIAGIVATKIKKNSIIIVLCSITILYTILNWGNRKSIPDINDTILRSQTVFDEHPGYAGVDLTTPKWVDQYKPWIGKKPKHFIETLSGQADFKTISHKIIHHSYIVTVRKDALIKENTYFYPGWKIFANNTEIPIIYNNKKFPGVMTFNLKKGTYRVAIILTDTPDQKISKAISLISAILLGLFILFYAVRQRVLSKKNH